MKTPNILFIFSDQHTRRVTGCYGDEVVKTPNLDRLAREGVRFDNAYCPSPICVPSRMSMLTSRWPHRQDCWANDDVLRSDLPTWLHGAGAAGYDPVLIGRMHAMGPDQLHGYASRLIGDHSPNYGGVARISMGVLEGTNNPTPVSVEKSGAGLSVYQTKDAETARAASDWLRGEGAAKQAKGEAFCLTVGLMLPHAPYVADREAFEFYRDRIAAPRLGAEAGDHEWYNWWRENRGVSDVSVEKRDAARAAYWALVHRMDEMIGEVLTALESIGAMDDTLIVYASDHGDHVGERDLWWKHTFYDESAKVPLIMRLPGRLPAGETRNQVVNLIDLSQTMLEAMGAPPLPHADGRSFWGVAKHDDAPWENVTFSEYCTDAVPGWTGGRAVQQRMIRRGDWKLCIFDTEPPLLFDLAADPDETKNRATDPACAIILKELTAELTAEWTAKDIAARMKIRRAEKDLIGKWEQAVQPESSYFWRFSPDDNRLGS